MRMLGIALDTRSLGLADLKALGRGADDAGFSSVWIPDTPARDALVVAAVVGAATKRAAIAAGPMSVFARSAVSLAVAAATAAEACDGRFVLGIAAGQAAAARAWFGADWKRPRLRVRETAAVVRDVLSGDRVWHEGEFRVDGFHLASKPAPVPLHLGVLTPASLRMAGEIAEGVLLDWLPAEAMQRCALVAREAAADASRHVWVAGRVRVAVAESEDERSQALAALRDEVYLAAALPPFARSLRQHGVGAMLDRLYGGDDAVLDALVDTLCICPTASAVPGKVAELASLSGLDEVVVQPVPFGDEPAETVLHAIRTLRP